MLAWSKTDQGMKQEMTMGSQTRNVILYELNEVPWSVVDYYVEKPARVEPRRPARRKASP